MNSLGLQSRGAGVIACSTVHSLGLDKSEHSTSKWHVASGSVGVVAMAQGSVVAWEVRGVENFSRGFGLCEILVNKTAMSILVLGRLTET